MQIEGQTALVTGGGSGLGAATARVLAAHGARVGILDHDGDKASAVAAEIGGTAQQCDVTDAAAVQAAVAAIGAPRIVVNCAGIAHAARMVNRDGDVSIDLFRRVMEVNVIGTYAVMSYATQAMQSLDTVDGERGVIVNTASVAYQDGQIGQAAYAGSKGAVASMCLPLAREMASMGVRICAIAPGLFQTPMMESLPEETTAQIVSNIQFPKRLGDPSEFGALVAHIVQNRYLNGEVIRLDGATRIPPR